MRFRWVARVVVVALGSLGLGACLSGQTGSPDCVGATSCVCDPLFGAGTLLRVHVERLETGKLEAVVDEVFAAPQYAHAAEVGDRVGGALLAEQPCASDADSALQVGGELLVLYSAGSTPDFPNCSAFQACAAADCASLPEPELSDCWTTCDAKTNEFCTQQRSAALLDGVFSWAVPWGETLSFGQGHELASSDISVMFSYASCVERFPAPPAPPCNDTIHAGPCSAAPGASTHGASSWAVLLGLVVARRLRRSAALVRPGATP